MKCTQILKNLWRITPEPGLVLTLNVLGEDEERIFCSAVYEPDAGAACKWAEWQETKDYQNNDK